MTDYNLTNLPVQRHLTRVDPRVDQSDPHDDHISQTDTRNMPSDMSDVTTNQSRASSGRRSGARAWLAQRVASSHIDPPPPACCSRRRAATSALNCTLPNENIIKGEWVKSTKQVILNQ